MLSALMNVVVLLTALLTVGSSAPAPVSTTDTVKLEKALREGFSEVEAAIALRDKIIARGHDFNKDPIPEFEEHLPHIVAFYTPVFKDNPKKIAAFQKRVDKMRAMFKKNAVLLRDWNDFHGFLNQLLETNASDFYGTQFFDNFICFVYRAEGEIGVQTKNFADANHIWALPMTTTPKLRMHGYELTPSEFTNALLPFADPLKEVGPDALRHVYERIEKLGSPQERARAHLALYSLLRHSQFPAQEYMEPGDIRARFLLVREDMADSLINIRLTSKTQAIYRSLRSDGADREIVINALPNSQYRISGETGEGVPYHFFARLESNADGTFQLKYTNNEGTSFDTQIQLGNTDRLVDRYAKTLAQALEIDTSSVDTLMNLVDDFIATQTTNMPS